MRLLPLLVAAVLVAACDSGGGDEPPPEPPPPPAITRAELEEHLVALQRIANRYGDTRAAGTPGYEASVEYVAERLREARWRVEVQQLEFPYFELRSASVHVDGRRLRRERDFQVLSHSGSGRVNGPLRPSGDGCSSSDFAGMPRGELPLVARGGCFFREKAQLAQRAGARALVVVDSPRTNRGLPSGTLAGPGIRIPVVLVTVRAIGQSPAGVPVRLAVDAVSEERVTQNVIAESPGGSEERVVMAGGHLDSVAGAPGIEDNGSGVAALIEVAEAIAAERPAARVRLGFWAAEELGLVGSRHYVRALSDSERRSIRAYLNLDMVGSPNPVPELYGDGDRRLARVLRRVWRGRLDTVTAGGASDHAPFRDAGIPINGLYTGATERGPRGRARDPCYHLPCDTLRNVNRPILLRMSRAAARAMAELAGERR